MVTLYHIMTKGGKRSKIATYASYERIFNPRLPVRFSINSPFSFYRGQRHFWSFDYSYDPTIIRMSKIFGNFLIK